MLMAKYDFSAAQGGDYVVALITLLYVNFLDTSGTLLAMVSFYPPRDRSHNNHSFDPYNNKVIVSSNFEGRFDEDQRYCYDDNLGPGRY